MQIYFYHPVTGEFLGSGIADIDLLEKTRSGKDRYLIPAGATIESPPDSNQYQTPCWVNGEWQLRPDYRAASVCELDADGFFKRSCNVSLGEELMGRIIADPPDDSMRKPKWFNSGWVDGRTLDEYKDDCLMAAAAKRFEIETGGITVNGVSIRTDRESQSTLNGALTALQGGFVGQVDWKASSGWVPVGLAEITPFAQAVAIHVQACFSAERAHGTAIHALTTVEELKSYDIEAGWPGTNF